MGEPTTGMLYPVIMAGGSGTRLWPMSRRDRPKQALRLTGDRSLFQEAVDRLAPDFPPERIFVVTKADHVATLRSQSPDLPADNFLVEPEGRGTAPALGLAAIHLRRRDPEAVMAVLTADHHIADADAFRQVLKRAQACAQEGHLVTIGITPASVSTGYGYIQMGESLSRAADQPLFRVRRFVEKPSAVDAERMVSCGEYLWNSGMFIWCVDRLLDEMERQMPELSAQLRDVDASLPEPDQYAATLARVWPQVREQTIDYGIMEGARDVAVIPASFGWTDVGSWSSLFELLPRDPAGNAWIGPHEAVDTRNVLVMGGSRLIATIGVENLVIIDTDDALLVCAKGREQDVRQIVRQLKETGRSSWL